MTKNWSDSDDGNGYDGNGYDEKGCVLMTSDGNDGGICWYVVDDSGYYCDEHVCDNV